MKLLFSFYSVFVSQLTAYVDSPLIGQSLLVGITCLRPGV